MADPVLLRRSPLGVLATAFEESADDAHGARLVEHPFLTMVALRVDPTSEVAAAIEAALGTALPRSCGQVGTAEGLHVLWLGPDEWLVVAATTDSGLPAVLAAAVATASADGSERSERGAAHAAVVDVSANRTTLELTGPAARQVLEKGCPVDLHPRAFEPGRAVATTLARVPVLLWQVGPDSWRLLPRASFAHYVASWLLDSMREFTPGRSAGPLAGPR